MKISFILDEELAARLTRRADQTGITASAVIREALMECLDRPQPQEWPEAVRNFKGVRRFPRFEKTREERR